MVRYRDVVGDGGSEVAAQLDAFEARLAARLESIDHVLLVTSGKGGVGKSSVAVNLATSFALEGLRVGVLDGDVYGSSVPKMLGIQRPNLVWEANGVQPPIGPANMPTMSLEFLLRDEKTPVAWDGPRQEAFSYRGNLEFHALREMLADTTWGALDLLVIDLPPGTNQAVTLCDLLPKLDGLVVVSIPTEVASLVVNRAMGLLNGVMKAPVLGVIENMCGYLHVETGAILPLFAEKTTSYGEVPLLGRLPFDHRMALACDQGQPYVQQFPDSPTTAAFNQLRQSISEMIFQRAEV